MTDSPSDVRIAIDVNTRQNDLTAVVTSIVGVMLEPYNDLLTQMAEDGRLKDEEADRLREQILERGKRLGELVREDLAR